MEILEGTADQLISPQKIKLMFVRMNDFYKFLN